MVDPKIVMELRNRTGAGMMECKSALEEAGSDMEKAIEVLRRKGVAKAAKKTAERTASEGMIATYLHHNKRLAAMVELLCETDFSARTDEFQALANDIAMQVAAMNPEFVSPETIPAETLEKMRAAFTEEMAGENKPDEIKAKIVEGKLAKWYSDACLTKQAFFKNEEKTIEQIIIEYIAKTGEKVVISRFARFEMAISGKVC